MDLFFILLRLLVSPCLSPPALLEISGGQIDANCSLGRLTWGAAQLEVPVAVSLKGLWGCPLPWTHVVPLQEVSTGGSFVS